MKADRKNSHVLTILDEDLQNGLKYDHLKAEILLYRPLYFSPGSKQRHRGLGGGTETL